MSHSISLFLSVIITVIDSHQNRLQHVLVNFLSNAVKFSIAGSIVTIEVGSAVKRISRRPSDAGSFYSARGSVHSKSRKLLQFSRRNKVISIPSVPNSNPKDQQIRFVTVIVNDSGAGIPEDDHGKTE